MCIYWGAQGSTRCRPSRDASRFCATRKPPNIKATKCLSPRKCSKHNSFSQLLRESVFVGAPRDPPNATRKPPQTKATKCLPKKNVQNTTVFHHFCVRVYLLVCPGSDPEPTHQSRFQLLCHQKATQDKSNKMPSQKKRSKHNSFSQLFGESVFDVASRDIPKADAKNTYKTETASHRWSLHGRPSAQAAAGLASRLPAGPAGRGAQPGSWLAPARLHSVGTPENL